MTAIFLQVRLDSTRLPRKALLELAGLSVVEHAMRSLNGVSADVRVLLTTGDSAGELEMPARSAGWEVFTGPKDDVLERFILASRRYGVQRIVRATGDNPLVSASMAEAALDLSRETLADYAGFGALPLGSGVEILDAAALEEAYRDAEDPYEREHVAPFLYRHPERFRIVVPEAPESCRGPGMRLTLDTPEDYTFLAQLFDELYEGEPLDLDRVLPWLRQRDGDAR